MTTTFQEIKKTEDEKKDGYFTIAALMNGDSIMEIHKKLDAVKEGFIPNIHLDFEKCNRIDASGVRALEELHTKIASLGKTIYVINISSTPYKALKLTGKFDTLKFPHRGDI
jgi:anti-anti-sigma regulatory factor